MQKMIQLSSIEKEPFFVLNRHLDFGNIKLDSREKIKNLITIHCSSFKANDIDLLN